MSLTPFQVGDIAMPAPSESVVGHLACNQLLKVSETKGKWKNDHVNVLWHMHLVSSSLYSTITLLLCKCALHSSLHMSGTQGRPQVQQPWPYAMYFSIFLCTPLVLYCRVNGLCTHRRTCQGHRADRKYSSPGHTQCTLTFSWYSTCIVLPCKCALRSTLYMLGMYFGIFLCTLLLLYRHVNALCIHRCTCQVHLTVVCHGMAARFLLHST